MINTGIQQATKIALIKTAPRSSLTGNSVPSCSSLTKEIESVPILNAFELRCLMIQLSYMETDSNVAYVSGTRLGKYGFTEHLLTQYGYINNSGWTGLDGIDTQDIFLDNEKVQDSILEKFFNENYIKLIRINAIKLNDDKSVVAGMLAVTFQFQDANSSDVLSLDKTYNETLNSIKNLSNVNYIAFKAKVWREQGNQLDSLGRPGGLFFKAGKYAIQSLAFNT